MADAGPPQPDSEDPRSGAARHSSAAGAALCVADRARLRRHQESAGRCGRSAAVSPEAMRAFGELGANLVGIEFLMVVAAIWFGCNNAARDVVGEWTIFQRERMVNLKLPSYVFSKFAIMVALCVLQCLALLTIVYVFCDLRGRVPAERGDADSLVAGRRRAGPRHLGAEQQHRERHRAAARRAAADHRARRRHPRHLQDSGAGAVAQLRRAVALGARIELDQRSAGASVRVSCRAAVPWDACPGGGRGVDAATPSSPTPWSVQMAPRSPRHLAEARAFAIRLRLPFGVGVHARGAGDRRARVSQDAGHPLMLRRYCDRHRPAWALTHPEAAP